MNANCLILNGDYQPMSWLPLSVVDWKQAIKLHFLGRIKVIEWYDTVLHSPSTMVHIPAVAVTRSYHKFQKGVKFSSYNIILRDLFTCQYCGESFGMGDLNIDHVIPSSKGGDSSWENCVASCYPCNEKKADSVGRFKPLRKPFRPDHHLLANSRKRIRYELEHPSWAQYLQIEVEEKVA